jgi:hypothetical protein
MPSALSLERHLAAIAACNQAWLPWQWLALALAGLAIWLAWSGRTRADRVAALLLGAFWLAGGLGFLWRFLGEINPMARVFGGLCALQGVAFLVWGLWPGAGPGFWPRRDGQGVMGAAILVYGLILLPLLDLWQGLAWPRLPLVGIFPTPTAFLTFGLLLWTRRPVPLGLLLVPIAWALLDSYASVVLGLFPEAALAMAGVAACALLLPRPQGPRLHW